MKNKKASIPQTGLNRRTFLASAAAAGFAATASGLLIPRESLAADEPQRGGHLVLGLDGGQTTDILDPGTYAGSTMFLVGFTWGDRLVTTDPVPGSPSSSSTSSRCA